MKYLRPYLTEDNSLISASLRGAATAEGDTKEGKPESEPESEEGPTAAEPEEPEEALRASAAAALRAARRARGDKLAIESASVAAKK
jgi:hypothetical protein